MSINRGACAGKRIKGSACITEVGSQMTGAEGREGTNRSAGCLLRWSEAGMKLCLSTVGCSDAGWNNDMPNKYNFL